MFRILYFYRKTDHVNVSLWFTTDICNMFCKKTYWNLSPLEADFNLPGRSWSRYVSLRSSMQKPGAPNTKLGLKSNNVDNKI